MYSITRYYYSSLLTLLARQQQVKKRLVYMKKQKTLLFLSTFGGYPNFDTVFRENRFQVTKVQTLRKALSSLKQIKPDVIVAEFIYAPTYGSQLSNFESLFAAAQTYSPHANFIALVHRVDLEHLAKVSLTFSLNQNNYQVLTLPANASDLAACLNSITEDDQENAKR